MTIIVITVSYNAVYIGGDDITVQYTKYENHKYNSNILKNIRWKIKISTYLDYFLLINILVLANNGSNITIYNKINWYSTAVS